MQKNNLIGLVIATSLGLSSLAGCVVSPGGVTPGGTKAGTATTPGATKPATGTGTATKPGTGTTGTPTVTTPTKVDPVAPAKPVAVGAVPASQAQAGAVASQETAAALTEERDMDDYDALASQEGAAAAFQLQMVGAEPAEDGKVAITSGLLDGADGLAKGGDALRAGADALRAGDDALRAGDDALRAGDEALRAAARARAKARIAAELGIEAVIEARLGGGKLTAEQEAKLRAAAAKITANRADFDARRAEMKASASLKLAADLTLKVKAHQKNVTDRVKVRLEKLKDARDKIKGAAAKSAWVDNGDGTKSKTLDFDVTKSINGKTFTRTAKILRTVNADGVLVLASADFQQTLPNGLSRTSSRTKTLNEDGSYAVVFHSELVLPKGGKRVAHWEKTIGADGTVTGTGKIVWTDAAGVEKKTVTVALGGSEEEPTAAVEDAVADTEAEITVNDDGTVEASVESSDGKTEDVKIDTTDDGSVEVAVSNEGAISVNEAGEIVVSDGEATLSTDGTTTTASVGNETATTTTAGGVTAEDDDAKVVIDANGTVAITDK